MCQLRAGTVLRRNETGRRGTDAGPDAVKETYPRLRAGERLVGRNTSWAHDGERGRTGGFVGRRHKGKGFFFRSAWPDSAHSQSETELVPGATWVGGKMTSEAFS